MDSFLYMLVIQHAIPDSDLGKNILGLGGLFFYFTADICHINTQNLIVVVHIGSPYGIHNKAVGQCGVTRAV